jgi:hypothetical protein
MDQGNYPGLLNQMMRDAYIEAAQQLGLPKPPRYTRGAPPGPLPAHVPVRRPLKRLAALKDRPELGAQGGSSLKNGVSVCCGSLNPVSGLQEPAQPFSRHAALAVDGSTSARAELNSGAGSSTSLRSDIDSRAGNNVVPLPRGMHAPIQVKPEQPINERPTNGVGMIDPSVLQEQSSPNPRPGPCIQWVWVRLSLAQIDAHDHRQAKATITGRTPTIQQ